tara:strand:- start:37563 stop:41423 length:3861 start_codon:yes stop_codon:yes gene_type:complete
MKKIILLLLFVIGGFQSFSQTPGISYQAVILNPNVKELPGANAQSNILTNSKVVIQFTISDEFNNQEYQEYHQTSTDAYGMINLLIGHGTTTGSSNFEDIVWNGFSKKLKVDIDFSGVGNNFISLNEQELTFMPQPALIKDSDAVMNNTADIVAEQNRATDAESVIQLDVNANEAVSISSDVILQTNIDAIKTSVDNIDLSITTAVDTVQSDVDANEAATQTALDLKVDKVSGKGLSTEDYSTAEKTKLTTISGTNTGDQDLSSYATNTNLALKADIASPIFTGTPILPTGTIATTQNAGDNTTSIATTAFVTTATSGKFVDLTTNQNISGVKTFNSNINVKGVIIGLGAAGVASNTSIGVNALVSNSTGINNVAIGEQAGFSITGSNNVAIGTATNRNAAEGDSNVAIGNGANYQGTSGSHNISLGTLAYRQGNSGSSNIAMGLGALYQETTGSNNIALGNNSSRSNDGGEGNITLGYQAGNKISTGDYNVVVGYDADVSSGTLTNATAIGNGAIVTASNKIQLGNSSVTLVSTSGVITSGAVTYPNTDGTANQVLKTDGSGVLSWTTDAGGDLVSTNNLSDLSNTTTARTNLGLVIGTNVQAYDADLDDLSDGTLTATKVENGAYMISSAGTSSEVWTSDGDGAGIWAAAKVAVSIADTDADTKIQVEESADEDKIRFDLAGAESFVMENGTGGVSRLSHINTTQNVIIGNGAMDSADNANGSDEQYNVAIGYNAAYSLNGGSWEGNLNTIIGHTAGYSMTASASNTMVGQAAGYYTTGDNNTFLGQGAGYRNTTGEFNTFLGRQAGNTNTGGNNNVAIGYRSIFNNGSTMGTGNSNNTVIGHQAGYKLGNNDDGNVMLGYQAGYNETGSNTLYIDNSNTTTPLIYGDFDTDALTVNGSLTATSGFSVNNGSTSAGTMAVYEDSDDGSNKVTIQSQAMAADYTLTLPVDAGTASQVLTTDGSGALAWSTLSNTATSYSGVLPVANGGTGSSAKNFVDLTTNQTIAGTKNFSADITINSTKFGKGAGSNANSRNVAVGNSSLISNTSGQWNSAIGTYALQKNTTGSSNTAIGNEAISESIPGSNNTGLGSRALMYTSGTGNTSVGTNALINSSTGNNNTSIGLNAFSTNTTGSNNTAIGASTVVSSAGLTNTTAIGYGAMVAASNTMQLGNTSITDVKTSGAITANSYIKSGGTSSQFLMADGSVSSGAASVIEVADEFSATASQTSFTLTQTPSVNSKVKMYVNGIRISNSAYSVSGATLTYVSASNGGYALASGDRIQFDYFY